MAGMAEANLTGLLIEMQWKNTMGSYCSTPSDYCTKLEAFLSNNSDFMTEQINSVGGDYWHQVSTQACNETVMWSLMSLKLNGLFNKYLPL